MEKWRSRGKGSSKTESVLPPTRRPPSQACLPIDKKKDRKWSFGGFLKKISSGQNNDVSSNEEEITYIPGHMLPKKKVKKTSKMKSKLGKIPHQSTRNQSSDPMEESSNHNGSKDTLELIRSLEENIDQPQQSICPSNDSVNSRSSEGSLDALGKNNRRNRMKARAQAKRDRLCGNSSSDDDSHVSNQSLIRFRSEDNIEKIQKQEPFSRRTRGARTERYIKRIYRDDGTSGSDSKILKPNVLPRFNNSLPLQYSSASLDSNIWKSTEATRNLSFSGSSLGVAPPHLFIGDQNSPPARDHHHHYPYDTRTTERSTNSYLRDMNENETFEREKCTWPQTIFCRSNPSNKIYGSLRVTHVNAPSIQQKTLPPEPPPRSSKSRVFSNAYNTPYAMNNGYPSSQQSTRQYLAPTEMKNTRSYNSDNEILLSDYVAPTRLRFLWQNSDPVNHPHETTADSYKRGSYYGNVHCNSLDRSRRSINKSYPIREKRNFCEEQENYDPRRYFPNSAPPPNSYGRSTYSLPKGVELFSRQKSIHCEDCNAAFNPSRSPSLINANPIEDEIIPTLRNPLETSRCHNPSACCSKVIDDNEAERKRSSKNLEEALSELEAIYNSLRLSDEDLLERAEQRSMEEYRDKAAKNAGEHSLKSWSDTSSNEKDDVCHDHGFVSPQQETDDRMKDDMAYRRMNPKERPPSVNGQASLPQISYLATSPNLSRRETDSFDHRPRSNHRCTPDLTRDDVLFRSISHANNTLKVIEPQPPFGIPLGPVTSATESDYLHIKPTKLGQSRSLYIPQSEPDVVTDDLAFRNLRKDSPKDASVAFNKNANLFIQMDAIIEPRVSPKNTFSFETKKKRAVRSLSADLYGIMTSKENNGHNDWYNDYIKSTQKLRVPPNNDVDTSLNGDKGNLYNYNFKDVGSQTLDTRGTRRMLDSTSKNDLDINGNRPKSALQRKIQVYVPQETFVDKANDKWLVESNTKFERSPRDLFKVINNTESDDSSPERCDSRFSSSLSDVPVPFNNKTIEPFTEQEISEYQKLCNDLEKLIQRTSERDNKKQEETRESEGNNSQSEFDVWEKLLNEDYDLPVSIAALEETVQVTTNIEKEDDQSSSRSMVQSLEESQSSDHFTFTSPTKSDNKFVDDDGSSASELAASTNNTTGSSIDNVYNKFNKLLKEVNDVPFVELTNILKKYPTDEFTEKSILHNEQDRAAVENTCCSIVKQAKGFNDTKSTGNTVAEETQGEITSTATTSNNSVHRIESIEPNTYLLKEERTTTTTDPKYFLDTSTLWTRRGGTRERKSPFKSTGGYEAKVDCKVDDDVTPSYREGEKIEDERVSNDELYACKDNNSMHPIRKLCHVTNSITTYHIVLCSLFLTLLISVIVAH